VLICSRNRRQMLIETVRSVLAGDEVPAELVVVDQSTEPDPELAGLGVVRGCTVRYLPSATTGLSRARNIALRAAAHPVVVLIDDDMFVEPDWLGHLLDGRRRGGERTVATGRVLPAPPEGRGAVPAAGLVLFDEPAVYRGRQPRDVVPGANVAAPRDVLLAIGGYDERLGAGTRFSAADDNDIGLRLLDAGCEVRHVPEAVVLHRAWRSAGDRLQLRWNYGRGKGAFYAKHAGLRDRYTLRRMAGEVAMRVRRGLREARRSPKTAAGELVALAALASGALSWTVRERRPRVSRPSAGRRRT
jgi:GT2 family glycosyltransferase